MKYAIYLCLFVLLFLAGCVKLGEATGTEVILYPDAIRWCGLEGQTKYIDLHEVYHNLGLYDCKNTNCLMFGIYIGSDNKLCIMCLLKLKGVIKDERHKIPKVG